MLRTLSASKPAFKIPAAFAAPVSPKSTFEPPANADDDVDDDPLGLGAAARSRRPSNSRSVVVRVGGGAKTMLDFFVVVQEVERRFGKVYDFRMHRVRRFRSFFAFCVLNLSAHVLCD